MILAQALCDRKQNFFDYELANPAARGNETCGADVVGVVSGADRICLVVFRSIC